MNHSRSSDLDSITASHRSREQASNVACDACVLINFLNVGRIDILGQLSQYQFRIPDAADAEVIKCEQRRDLDTAYRERVVYRAGRPRIEEIKVFASLTRSMGKGEAACLAAARCRGWMLASDERGTFRRTAIRSIGQERIMGTADILVAAIRNESITLARADQIKACLEEHAFKMRFPSFFDLLYR